MKEFAMRLKRSSSAPPEVLYDLVADLRTHLSWGGEQQSRMFRLLSIDAPDGPAIAGTAFSSTGAIPMSSARFADRSTVTVAERPDTFEFVTHATVPGPARTMKASYRHRYEIEAVAGGSAVTYELIQLEISNPSLRLGLPGVRAMTWRIGIPFMAGRGFRNLLATADRASYSESAQLNPSPADSR